MSCGPEPAKDCPLCPRLVAYRAENARQEPDWFNGPAPSFGDPNAHILVVGLAPGRTGANRTGRPFTGDYAGEVLYAALARHGLSDGIFRADPNDGLRLNGVMITNAVRCAPPKNKPETSEIANCLPFLRERLACLPNVRTIIVLGRIAHDATLAALNAKKSQFPFAHGAQHQVGEYRLVSSYHCSRYNMNTNRLTVDMFDAIFRLALASA